MDELTIMNILCFKIHIYNKHTFHKIVILAIKINIEENGQLFLKTCFGMLMPSSV